MSFKVNTISFCKKTGDNVQDSDTKGKIIDILKTKYNINFKSNRAMILTSKTINYLRNPHFISVKTTGTNYFLFLTNINHINYAFYIDRKVKQGYTYPRIISVKYSFNDDVFKDTLLDGELVKDKDNNWMFLISDLILAEGVLLKQNISYRINYLYELLSKKYREDQHIDICPLVVKKFFNYSQYNELIALFLPNLTYGVRGLYFNSLNTKHATHLFLYPQEKDSNKSNKSNKSNNSNKFIKKQDESNKEHKSLTFQIKSTIQPEIYDLYYKNETNDLIKFDTARVSNLRSSKLISKLFKENDVVFVNCKFNPKFAKWEPFESSQSDTVCSKTDLN